MLTYKKTSDPQASVESPSMMSEPAFHSTSVTDTVSALGVDLLRGLDATEVEKRRIKYGANALQTIRPTPIWRLLLNQFTSIIVVLLLVAAFVAYITSREVEAFVILIVLILNALVGFFTEWQAGRALDALRRQSQTMARVKRGERQVNLDAQELVPGDIIILNPGDRVPADARLINSANLMADESILTGESITVDKAVESVPPDTPIAERRSMLYLGTTITAGHASAIVTATGIHTELGHIGKLVASAPVEKTPLEMRLAHLGQRLIYIVLAIAAIVIITGWIRGDDFWLMIEVGISLAVAAVPEALPAVTTLSLAIGVLRMARQRAIVRRLPAVETLGSTSIICTDKTGTLTENRLTVREFRLSDGRWIDLNNDKRSLTGDELTGRIVRVGVLCNEASLTTDTSAGVRGIGDPTETALLIAADDLGADVQRLRSDYPKLTEVPFDSVTKRMITIHEDTVGNRLVVLKGAPAVVLESSNSFISEDFRVHKLDEKKKQEFTGINDEMANRALRVLGLAEKVETSSEESDMDSGYTFLGFVGMMDPPRSGVLQAIEEAREAGIRFVMLTGDQINTAHAIAHELKLNGDIEPKALHARDLEGLGHEELVQLANQVDVFARVSPADKLHIVEALKQSGEIVAVTGDGINDAPALKTANIGIAMGERGAEAAKEAADVVLTDDNFATIIKAIEGGRTIYANIIKFIHLMFSKNLGMVLAIFVAILAGLPLPLLPLQILWMNLVTDVFPALALALEPPTPGIMERRYRSTHSTLLSNRLLFLIGWQAVMLATIILFIYSWAINTYGEGAHARTIALVTLISVQLGHMFNCRSRTQSAFVGLFRNPYLWIATLIIILLQLIAVYLQPIGRVLDTVHLTRRDWAIISVASLIPIIIVEITKLISRKVYRKRAG